MKSVLLGETGVANVRVVPTVISGRRAPPINFRGLQMDPFTPLTSGEKHQRREKIKDCSRENKGGKQRKDCTVGEGI